jgi:hypothetical protein
VTERLCELMHSLTFVFVMCEAYHCRDRCDFLAAAVKMENDEVVRELDVFMTEEREL